MEIDTFMADIEGLLRLKKTSLEKTYSNASFSVGKNEESICLSALLHGVSSETPDLIEVVISFRRINENLVVSGDVIWGDGNGCVEAAFEPDDVLVISDSLEKLYNYTPKLLEVFEECIIRRKPSR